VTKVIPVTGWLLCSAPGVNKVYASDGGFTLNVIDCGSDSVIRTISLPVNDFTSAMCYVAYDKLYISTMSDVFVVDCVKDSLIRSYRVDYNLVAAGREGKRVICATTDSLLTFDPATDTVVAHVPWEFYSLWEMVYAPGVDKVYCVDNHGRILVGDCATDSLIAEIPLEQAWTVGYESSSGLVCCSRLLDSTITFIDSRTDSIVARFDLEAYHPRMFLPVPAHRRIYVGCDYTSSVPVIRTDPSGIEEAPCAEVPATNASPTVMQGALLLPGATGSKPQAASLLDVSGRKVLDLHPGANDVRALAPGVYFIRQGLGSRGEGLGETRKIVLSE
jgi:hypothetical protein